MNKTAHEINGEVAVIDMMYIISDAIVMCENIDNRQFRDREILEEALAKAMALLYNILDGGVRYGIDRETQTSDI